MSIFERVVARMSEPSFYAGKPARVDVRETHVSMVFLAGDRAYKVKKPVRMPFLDYSSLEQRRRFCEEEVRLNRRFAPDVYLGVDSVVEREDDLALSDGAGAGALEHVVVMRRFADDDTLERMVERGAVDEQLAERIGSHVAELHLAAPRAPADYWTPEHIAARLEDNFDTTQPDVGSLVDSFTLDAVRRFSRAFLTAHAPVLQRRVDAGMVRDVHGDLRAEHFVIEGDRISVIDCIEFDERLRLIDVAADLAFLIMDLERLGAHDVAESVERAYTARTGDPDLHTLLPFYSCYSEWVRAKVTAGRVRQLAESDPARPALEAHARRLFELSLRLAWRARLPLVIALRGDGPRRSALAAELSRRSGLPHLSSDGAGAELPLRAAAAVAASGGAVVDAADLRPQDGWAGGSPATRVLWVECPGGSPEPPGAPSPGDHLVVSADHSLEQCLDQVDSFVSDAVDAGRRVA